MHSADENDGTPRRRLQALALIRSTAGAVLLIEKAHRTDRARWALPGGFAGENESVPAACQRQILAGTGLHIVPGRVLVIHDMPRATGPDEGVSIVFDGGTFEEDVPFHLSAAFLSCRWVSPEGLDAMVVPSLAWDIDNALHTLTIERLGAPLLVGDQHRPEAG